MRNVNAKTMITLSKMKRLTRNAKSAMILERGSSEKEMARTSGIDASREIELKLQFVRMTRQEIETMMNTTDNTTTRLICWEYLQTF